MENWKPVQGANGRYEVSDLGNVRSLIAPGGARILKPGSHPKSGHQIAMLMVSKGVRTAAYVHHLVLESFVGARPEGLEGCHGDGDPKNNALSNLRWDTRSNNIRDAVKHGTHHWAKKTRCPRGHEYDRVRYRRSGPKAGQSFRACSTCENRPRKRR